MEEDKLMFVSGGTSSIGRVFVRQLVNEGYVVRVLVRPTSDLSGLELPGVRFVYGDVTDVESVKKGIEGCRQVTHMAAVVGSEVPEETWWQVNREGTRNVLHAARATGVQSYVQVSSISVLGTTAPGEIADESRPVKTEEYLTLYQKTKRAADELVRESAAAGLQASIVYPCFGYGCSWASSHPSLQDQTLLRMAAGKPTAVMGSGKNRLCLSYYRDTCRGILLAHEKGLRGEDYILGGENLTLVDIWQAVAEVLGKEAPRRRIPLPLLQTISTMGRLVKGKPIFPDDFFDMIARNWCFSSRKAERELGWYFTSFREGIRETWMDYLKKGWKP